MASPNIQSQSASVGFGTGATATAPTPAGVQVGDLLLLVVAVDAPDPTPISASGYTQILSEAGSEAWLWIGYRIATGTDAYAATLNASCTWAAFALRIDGHDAATPIDDADSANGTGTIATAPASVATVADTLVLRWAMCDKDPFTGVPATEICNTDVGALSLAGSQADQAGTGSTGTADFTGFDDTWAAATVVVASPSASSSSGEALSSSSSAPDSSSSSSGELSSSSSSAPESSSSSSGELSSSSSSAPTAPIMPPSLLIESGRYLQGV